MFTAVGTMALIGLLIFFFIVVNLKKLLQKNESGFIHLLYALMISCYIPMPFATYIKLNQYDFLLVGAIIGTVSLIIMLVTMMFQCGHLSYSGNHENENLELWKNRDAWMLNGILGGVVEIMSGFLRGLWMIFLTIALFLDRQIFVGIVAIVFSMFTFTYLIMSIDMALVNKIPILSKIKLNSIVINLEMVLCFLGLAI